MCFYHLKRLQKVVLLGQINIKTNKMRQKAKGRPVRLTPFSVLNTVTYNLKSPVNLEFTVSLKRCSIIFFFHQKLLSMCSSTYIFFTRNHYLKCTTSLLSPTSAISMRPTFKVYVQSEFSSESNICGPRYICPISCRCKYFDRPPANRYLISELR